MSLVPSGAPAECYRFGQVVVDLERAQVTVGGEEVRCAPLVFRLLAVLCEAKGRVVSRSSLLERLWPDTVVSFDESLKQVVRKLRAVLGPDGDRVVTVRGVGLRLDGVERRVPPQASLDASEGTAPPASLPRRFWIALSLVAVAALVAASGWVGSASRGGQVRPSVAVLDPHDLTGDAPSAWLSTSLGEMLSAEIASSTSVRVAASEDVGRAVSDLEVPARGSLGRGTLAGLRSHLGVDWIVAGTYVVLGRGEDRQVRLDLHVQDTRTGRTALSVTDSDRVSNLLAIVARAGVRIRNALGTDAAAGVPAGTAARAVAPEPEAARLYALGLRALRASEPVEAARHLEAAAAARADFPLAHSALAEAYSEIGETRKARLAAQAAAEGAHALPREQALLVEARCQEVAGEWAQAADAYRALVALYPDDLAAVLRLQEVLVTAGRSRESVAVVAAARRLPPPLGDHPRLDLAEVAAATAAGDHAGQRDAVIKTIERAEARGLRRVAAEARIYLGIALMNQGDLTGAESAFAQAQAGFAAAGDPRLAAWAVRNLAFAAYLRGDLDSAQTRGQEALATYNRLGVARGRVDALMTLATIDRSRGRLDEGRRRLEEAAAIARGLEDDRRLAAVLGNLGEVLVRQGHLDAAAVRLEEMLSLGRKVSDPYVVTNALLGLADARLGLGQAREAAVACREATTVAGGTGVRRHGVSARVCAGRALAELGDLADAERELDQAAGEVEASGARAAVAELARVRGDVVLLKGDLNAARSRYREALQVYQEVRDTTAAQEVRLAMARLDHLEGRAREALKAADAARLGLEGTAHKAAIGRLGHARLLLDSGAALEARRLLVSLPPSEGLPLRLQATLLRARAAAAIERAPGALASVERAMTEAQQAGLVALELEARAALVAVAADLHLDDVARRQGERLRADAAERGFGLFAREPSAGPGSAARLEHGAPKTR